MIPRDARCAVVVLPLAAIAIHEHQDRYLDRVAHYVGLLRRTGADGPFLGLLSVKPLAGGRYELLDGHHRFCAYILCGRADALCVVIDETACEGDHGERETDYPRGRA